MQSRQGCTMGIRFYNKVSSMQKFPLPSQLTKRINQFRRSYPPQFWLLFWGTLVSTVGTSMIWPYLVVYISEQLDLPLASIGGLITLNAATSLIASFLAGSITDRTGRKWAMVISLTFNGLAYLAMIPARTLGQFALLMALRGAFRPLFRVGADAMLADLVPPQQRADAYALNRLSKNVGVALGPALGGFLAATSYSIAFGIAAITSILFSVLIAFYAHETLPPSVISKKTLPQSFQGYSVIFQDRVFLTFILGVILQQVSASMLWVLLAAYAKQNYGVTESLYGLIPTTNALMVVFLQVFVTKQTKKYPPLRVVTLGTFLYALGVGSISLGNGFWGFWMSMVIVTMGELMVIPTSSSYTANIAPEKMRGRYMSLLALTWGAGSLIGPVTGGFLNDRFYPVSIWYGGGLAGLLGALLLFLLSLRNKGHGSEPLA